MSHPDRRKQREKKKLSKQEMLSRKAAFNVVDLTPQNAVGLMNFKNYNIILK